jgi:hypothetical protein
MIYISILYNVKKSVIMNICHKIINNEGIKIKKNKTYLPVIDECKYLGFLIREDNEDDKHVVEKLRKIQKCVYSLNSYRLKPTEVNPKIKSFKFNAYCEPVGRYGDIKS